MLHHTQSYYHHDPSMTKLPSYPSEVETFRPPEAKRRRRQDFYQQRSDLEVSAIMRQWRHFRSDRRFTDLKVVCGKNNGDLGGVALHRIVLASCSEFITGILRDRGEDEATIILPDCDGADFLNLVQVNFN